MVRDFLLARGLLADAVGYRIAQTHRREIGCANFQCLIIRYCLRELYAL